MPAVQRDPMRRATWDLVVPRWRDPDPKRQPDRLDAWQHELRISACQAGTSLFRRFAERPCRVALGVTVVLFVAIGLLALLSMVFGQWLLPIPPLAYAGYHGWRRVRMTSSSTPMKDV